jgi:SH3-like domain-containing protein
VVNVRQEPGGAVIGHLEAGDTVEVLECNQNWCSISEPSGYVWQGCLTGLNKNLGCEAR